MLLKNPITEDKTIWAGLNHPELPLEEADIAVFGIPYDGGVSFRSGTCEAPQELRKITHTISPTTEDFRDISPVKVRIWVTAWGRTGTRCSPRRRSWPIRP